MVKHSKAFKQRIEKLRPEIPWISWALVLALGFAIIGLVDALEQVLNVVLGGG